MGRAKARDYKDLGRSSLRIGASAAAGAPIFFSVFSVVSALNLSLSFNFQL